MKAEIIITAMDLLPIGKTAKQAGVSTQSLQYYIMLGLIEPAKITETGRKLFDADSIEKIKLVKNLNKSGYPLRAIRDLFMDKKHGSLEKK